MNGKKAKMLRKMSGGYNEISKKIWRQKKIGTKVVTTDGFAKKYPVFAIVVLGDAYRTYKNLKREYKKAPYKFNQLQKHVSING